MISLENVHKTYRAGLSELHALEALSLEIRPGELVSIMGPSGSGKTTLLNMIGLIDTFDRGEYLLDGQATSALSDDQRARLRNDTIGFVFQGFNLIPDLTVEENVALPLKFRALSRLQRRERVEEALQQVGMSARLNAFPTQLSGGQQQRIALARAIVTRPRLILADEPTGNLDSANAQQVLELLEQLHGQGATVLIVTHDPAVSLRTRRTLHIHDGRLIDPKLRPVRRTLS